MSMVMMFLRSHELDWRLMFVLGKPYSEQVNREILGHQTNTCTTSTHQHEWNVSQFAAQAFRSILTQEKTMDVLAPILSEVPANCAACIWAIRHYWSGNKS